MLISFRPVLSGRLLSAHFFLHFQFYEKGRIARSARRCNVRRAPCRRPPSRRPPRRRSPRGLPRRRRPVAAPPPARAVPAARATSLRATRGTLRSRAVFFAFRCAERTHDTPLSTEKPCEVTSRKLSCRPGMVAVSLSSECSHCWPQQGQGMARFRAALCSGGSGGALLC